MPDLASDDAPEGDRLDLTALVKQWDDLDRFYREVFVPMTDREDPGLTARKFDESQPAGPRAYINAHSQILNGLEHIDALRILMADHVTPRAPWTLLRSVYEAGFWATWLLEPDAGQARRERGLRAEVQAHKQRTAFYAQFFKHQPEELALATREHPTHLATYRQEAEALGVPWAQLNNKINVVQELERLAVVREMDPNLGAATIAIWRSLSGMQHGMAYAIMVNSDIDDETLRPIVGGHQVSVTISDDAFVGSATAANMLLTEAMGLYLRRHTRP